MSKPNAAMWAAIEAGGEIQRQHLMESEERLCEAAFRAGLAHTDGLVAALERQADNMAFLLNNANVPTPWYEKFTQELADDRAALTAAKGQQQ